MHRAIQILIGHGHVLKAATEAIVLAQGGPIDPQSRINGGFDAFSAHVTIT